MRREIGTILSACLMLDHLGERIISRRIQYAVSRVIAAGEVQTYDMKRLKGSPEALSQGAATTRQMTDAIIEAL